MSYLDEHLNVGETVVFRTRLHEYFLTMPALVVVMLTAVWWQSSMTEMIIWPLVGAAFFWHRWMTYKSNEYGVTTQRVVIKTGWSTVKTLELQLNKVEALSVDQAASRYGTLIVAGTGGTKQAFKWVADPLGFRKAVQNQAAIQERSVHREPATAGEMADSIDAPSGSGAPATRSERDCPFCAERILSAAKVCKHCKRDVSPA